MRYVQYLTAQSKSERERFQSVKEKDEVWVKGIILEEEADVIYSKSKIKNKELWIWFTKTTNIHKNRFTRHCSRGWRYSSKPIKHSLCSYSSGLEYKNLPEICTLDYGPIYSKSPLKKDNYVGSFERHTCPSIKIFWVSFSMRYDTHRIMWVQCTNLKCTTWYIFIHLYICVPTTQVKI